MQAIYATQKSSTDTQSSGKTACTRVKSLTTIGHSINKTSEAILRGT